MAVTQQEHASYGAFVLELAREAGCFELSGNDVLWHYTNGDGLIGILESGKLRATQVAALNDSQEILYAREVYRKAIAALRGDASLTDEDRQFLDFVLTYLRYDPVEPDHGRSNFFVTCFSRRRDDLSQWDRYGKDNGYAIGFIAGFLDGVPNTTISRIVYDSEKQHAAADKLAEATLRFFREGLTRERTNRQLWMEEFFWIWNDYIYRLAPVIKDDNWSAEDECRVVHQSNGLSDVQFAQKRTMLARYIDLTFPRVTPRLPIRSILIGPGNDPGLTKSNIELLLEKKGYPNSIPVDVTKVSLRRT
jgi:Protein of unknown function (DUF2971)